MNTFCGRYCFVIWRSIPAQAGQAQSACFLGKGSLAALNQQLWFDAQVPILGKMPVRSISPSSGVRPSFGDTPELAGCCRALDPGTNSSPGFVPLPLSHSLTGRGSCCAPGRAGLPAVTPRGSGCLERKTRELFQGRNNSSASESEARGTSPLAPQA